MSCHGFLPSLLVWLLLALPSDCADNQEEVVAKLRAQVSSLEGDIEDIQNNLVEAEERAATAEKLASKRQKCAVVAEQKDGELKGPAMTELQPAQVEAKAAVKAHARVKAEVIGKARTAEKAEGVAERENEQVALMRTQEELKAALARAHEELKAKDKEAAALRERARELEAEVKMHGASSKSALDAKGKEMAELRTERKARGKEAAGLHESSELEAKTKAKVAAAKVERGARAEADVQQPFDNVAPVGDNKQTCSIKEVSASGDTAVAEALRAHVTSPHAEEPLIIRGGVAHWLAYWRSEGTALPPLIKSRVSLSDPFETAIFGPPKSTEWLPFNKLLENMSEPRSFLFGVAQGLRSKMLPKKLWGSLFDNSTIQTELEELEVTSLGKAAHGLPFHCHGAAILGLVQGSKHWMMLPPEDMTEDIYRRSIAHPRGWVGDAALRSCTQKAGDVVYTPSYWWHATTNGNEAGLHVGFGGQASFSSTTTLFSLSRSLIAARARDGLSASAKQPSALAALQVGVSRLALRDAEEGTISRETMAALSDILGAWISQPSYLPAFNWLFSFQLVHTYTGAGLELAVLLRAARRHIERALCDAKPDAAEVAVSAALGRCIGLLMRLGGMSSQTQAKGTPLFTEALDILDTALRMNDNYVGAAEHRPRAAVVSKAWHDSAYAVLMLQKSVDDEGGGENPGLDVDDVQARLWKAISLGESTGTHYEGVAESYEALKALGLALPPGAKKKERRNVEL